MRRRVPFILMALLFLSLSLGIDQARAEPTLDSVLIRLKKARIFRAGFKSTRHLKVLRDPLQSGGTLLIARDHGLIWEQESPFRQRLVITSKVMKLEIDGAEPVEIKVGDHPLVFGISKIFIAMFSGDRETLAENFAMTFRPLGGQGWLLSFKPLRAPIKQVIAQIQLRGNPEIFTLEISARNGDQTRIALNHVSKESTVLTAKEIEAFQP